MNRNEKIVAYVLMTYFIFGLSQLLASGAFIAPFLLNKTLLFVVAVLFLFDKKQKVKTPILLFTIASTFFLLSDRFLLSSILSHEQLPYFLGSAWIEVSTVFAYFLYTTLLFYIGFKLRPKRLVEKIGLLLLFALSVAYCILWFFPLKIDVQLAAIAIGVLLLVFAVKSTVFQKNTTQYALSLLFALQSGLEVLRLLSFGLVG